MKSICFSLFILLLNFLNAFGQTCGSVNAPTNNDPYISGLSFSLTSPWGAIGSSGTASFTLGNNGPCDLNRYLTGSCIGNSSCLLQVTISPNINYTVLGSSLATGISAPSGAIAAKFNWSYNSTTGVLTGIQNSIITNGESGVISFPYKNIAISTQDQISPCDGQANCSGTQVTGSFRGQNGMVINLQPASQPSNSSNLTSNDNLGRYEYTFTKLPLKTSDLSAKLMEGRKVELNWTSVIESNTVMFEVERYDQMSKIWKTIGVIYANQNTPKKSSYQHIDNFENSSVMQAYYRVKIIDLDNSFNYTSIRTINFKEGFNTRIFPNPFTEYFILEVNSSKDLSSHVNIIDMMGRTKVVTAVSILKGYNNFRFSTLDLPSGNYILTIDGIEPEFQKIVKIY